MEKIYRVKLNGLSIIGDFAKGKNGKSIEHQNGVIFVKGKDIEYIFENYNVDMVESTGLLLERNDT